MRELSKRVVESGDAIVAIEKQMKGIDKYFAEGKIEEGLRGLDRIIKDTETSLNASSQDAKQ